MKNRAAKIPKYRLFYLLHNYILKLDEIYALFYYENSK